MYGGGQRYGNQGCCQGQPGGLAHNQSVQPGGRQAQGTQRGIVAASFQPQRQKRADKGNNGNDADQQGQGPGNSKGSVKDGQSVAVHRIAANETQVAVQGVNLPGQPVFIHRAKIGRAHV